MSGSRTYQIRISSRACDNFGAVDYTVTEILTERDCGMEVRAESKGVREGTRFRESRIRFYSGVTMDRAHDYRMKTGYTRVA